MFGRGVADENDSNYNNGDDDDDDDDICDDNNKMREGSLNSHKIFS
jgi:hypothetical protein